MKTLDADVIVVGSGFGGAVCACRAAAAGLRVVVLERGRRMSPSVYEHLAQGTGALFHAERAPGPFELHRLRGLLAVTGSAVGGGSVVYTAVTVRAPREIFDDHWPAGTSYDELTPYYDRAQATIAPTRIPLGLSRTRALETIARRLSAPVTHVPLSMDWPADAHAMARRPHTDGVYHEVAVWLQGGREARKRTLNQTYLAQAESSGARIRPLHEVRAIVPERGAFRVDYRRLADGERSGGSMRARRVVAAAGALNTTALLLKCRDVLRTLPDLSKTVGRRFFTNGDFGALLVEPDLEVAPDAGPPVTAWLDLWRRERLFVMEAGLVPFDFGSFTGLLNPARWFGRMRLTPAKRCTWSFGTMGHDYNPGRLLLDRRGTIIHQHDPERGAPFRARTTSVLRQLAASAGAKLLLPPAAVARRWPPTVHPLGGAVMADSPDAGVTNAFGEVFGYPGLYVADGSMVPAPTGAPPSMTIAALAERVVEHLLKQC